MAQKITADGTCTEVMQMGSFHQITLVTPSNPVQGLAVYQGRWLFQLYHHGPCAVADITTGEFLGQYIMDGTENSHNNNACWGVEFPSDELAQQLGSPARFPYLYVSECGGSKKCYVEAVGVRGSRVVQEIFLDSDDYNSWNDWIVDDSGEYIYTLGRPRGGSAYIVKKFALPKVNGGPSKVYLTDSDKLDEYSFEGVQTSQGSQIYRGYLFLTANVTINERVDKQDIKVHVFNLSSRKQVETIDLSHCLFEPEGCSISDGYLYQSFANSRGCIYKLKIK